MPGSSPSQVPPTDSVVAVRRALGASTSAKDFELYCGRMVAEAERAEVDRYVSYMTLVCEADDASSLAEDSIRGARNAADLIERCFARAGVLLLLVLACSCAGQQQAVTDPTAFRTITGQPGRESVALATLESFRERHPVKADRIDLHFFVSADDQQTLCHGDAECTWAESNGWRINAYWPERWHTSHAYMFAHELCHVWFYQTGEGGDPNHTHTECFAAPGRYQNGTDTIGSAWDVAIEVTAAMGGAK